MELFVILFVQLVVVSFINLKAYYYIKIRFLRTAWIGPLLMFGVYVRTSVSEIRAGTDGSWSWLLTICVYVLLALSSLAAIGAGYLDRRDELSKPTEKRNMID